MCPRIPETLALAAAICFAASVGNAASIPPSGLEHPTGILSVAQKQRRPPKDCTPYNGPFGFYGNIWCQPPNEMSYMRNLGSPWPQETPPSLRKPKPSTGSDW
jgi:hypothetical protein